MKQLFIILLFVIGTLSLSAQNIGINTDGSTPRSLLHVHHESFTADDPLFQITNSTSGNSDNSSGFTINFSTDFDQESANSNTATGGISHV